jgi:valyl-tRNA synthetase
VPASLTVDDAAAAVAATYADEIGALTKLSPLDVRDGAPDGWPTLTVAGVRVALDLSDAIDVGAERARLTKDLESARREREQATAKLANADFTSKAPEHVVEKIRARRAAAEADIARLEGQLAALPAG